MSRFPNKAGDHADTDEILRAELKAAGIQTLQEHEGREPEYMADFLRRNSGEVKTSVMGVLHGWQFKRAWHYWMAEGPGIEWAAAEALHANHGNAVRVNGHCGCPSPTEQYKGLAVGNYHVDTPDGLKALADTIKALVARTQPLDGGGTMGITSSFFVLPADQTCIHPEHEPASGFYIPPGKGYRHVCPGCKTVRELIPLSYSLTHSSPACALFATPASASQAEKAG